MITPTEFAELQRDVKKLQSITDELQGRVASRLETLKARFGCSSTKEGRAKLKALNAKAKEGEKVYRELALFQEEWHDALRGQ